MKIIVCGGRDYGLTKGEVNYIRDELLKFHERNKVTWVATGGAKGVDTIARAWALSNGILIRNYFPDWKKYGRAAGPIRNREMLLDFKPDHVVVFPGGRGTEDMRHKAFVAEVDVTIIPKE
jgi:hypothetical protein|tara:strand:+ start:4447 stop:4809 length:363 start_codon:yes stop_codon:yes gene_type:complete